MIKSYKKEWQIHISEISKEIFFLPVLVPLVSRKVITVSAVMPVLWAMKDNIAKGMLWSYHTEIAGHVGPYKTCLQKRFGSHYQFGCA